MYNIEELKLKYNIPNKAIIKPIPGLEQYCISNCGLYLLGLKTGTLKAMRDNKRYKITTLCINGKRKTYYIARLVYMAHKGPIKDSMQIDHLDHDPQNNHIDNLSMVTQEENILKAHAHYGKGPDRITLPKGYKGKKWLPVVYGCIELGPDGQEVKRYDTLQQAIKEVGGTLPTLMRHLGGYLKTFAGRQWVMTIDGRRVGRGIPTPEGWRADKIKIIENGPNFTYKDFLKKYGGRCR